MNSLPTVPRAAPGAHAGALACKADLCAKVLSEARRLARLGPSGSALNQLVHRARELLEDIDEILATLGLDADAPERAIAAALHREVDAMRAEIAARRPNTAPGTVAS